MAGARWRCQVFGEPDVHETDIDRPLRAEIACTVRRLYPLEKLALAPLAQQAQSSRPPKLRQAQAGGPSPARIAKSDLCLLRDFKRVVHLNSKVSHCAFKFMYLCP
jgi:hypothetical protein